MGAVASDLSVDDKKLTAKRTDCPSCPNWTMDLAVPCFRPKAGVDGRSPWNSPYGMEERGRQASVFDMVSSKPTVSDGGHGSSAYKL